MNSKPIELANDTDLRASLVAIRRAAERARKIALSTGTRLVVAENGEWRLVTPADDKARQTREE